MGVEGFNGSLYARVECQTEQMDLKRKNMKGDISQCLILVVVEVSDVCTHACAEEVYVTVYLRAEFVCSVSTVVCQRRTCDH